MRTGNCVVCSESVPSPWRWYCGLCRSAVAIIQAGVNRQMREARHPPASGLCVDCGSPATDHDHRYYSLPLETDEVCSSCNTKRGPANDIKQLVTELYARKAGIRAEPQPKQLAPTIDESASLVERMNALERAELVKALESNRWNRTKAAHSLGITFRALRYRMERLSIN